MDTIKNRHDDTELRRRAEMGLETAAYRVEALADMSPEKVTTLIHELQVHQIELTMQNEELRRIQGELENERDRYSELYNFAPSGFVTLSDKGMILKANLTCESQFGHESS